MCSDAFKSTFIRTADLDHGEFNEVRDGVEKGVRFIHFAASSLAETLHKGPHGGQRQPVTQLCEHRLPRIVAKNSQKADVKHVMIVMITQMLQISRTFYSYLLHLEDLFATVGVVANVHVVANLGWIDFLVLAGEHQASDADELQLLALHVGVF
jgi:hypothetical protein